MHTDGGWDKNRTKSGKNSNSSYGSGKNAGVRKNGSGSNTAGTAHKKKTIRNVHKKKR